mmetsp:Transcript_7545/g.19165  ORF Transcript_7545/g.19165 Transcript_7545/m.19165 type:complete len:236 (-) Transcript_7545:264-971(-)
MPMPWQLRRRKRRWGHRSPRSRRNWRRPGRPWRRGCGSRRRSAPWSKDSWRSWTESWSGSRSSRASAKIWLHGSPTWRRRWPPRSRSSAPPWRRSPCSGRSSRRWRRRGGRRRSCWMPHFPSTRRSCRKTPTASASLRPGSRRQTTAWYSPWMAPSGGVRSWRRRLPGQDGSWRRTRRRGRGCSCRRSGMLWLSLRLLPRLRNWRHIWSRERCRPQLHMHEQPIWRSGFPAKSAR